MRNTNYRTYKKSNFEDHKLVSNSVVLYSTCWFVELDTKRSVPVGAQCRSVLRVRQAVSQLCVDVYSCERSESGPGASSQHPPRSQTPSPLRR